MKEPELSDERAESFWWKKRIFLQKEQSFWWKNRIFLMKETNLSEERTVSFWWKKRMFLMKEPELSDERTGPFWWKNWTFLMIEPKLSDVKKVKNRLVLYFLPGRNTGRTLQQWEPTSSRRNVILMGNAKLLLLWAFRPDENSSSLNL